MIADVFREELSNMMSASRKQGKKYIDVMSKELHTRVGGYPGTNHRMPVCCSVMYQMMSGNDEVLSSPPKGKGATLFIRYYL